MTLPITIAFLAVLILLSAYFSATETAFTSFNRIKIKTMADEGNKRAARTLELADKYDKLLSAILIGNNIVNITASSVATVLFVETLRMQNGAWISTAVMTVAILICGEICPKGIAKERPEQFAMFSMPFMRILLVVFTPLVWFFVKIKNLVAKLFRTKEDRGMTDSELITMVEEAAQEGGIDKMESELIKSAISFHDLEADEILTPRVDIVALDVDKDQDDVQAIFTEHGFSRLPVYEDTIDNVIGILHQKDWIGHEDVPMRELLQPVSYVHQKMKIGDILKRLQKEKTHMVIVTDEYGGTLGLITMEDILEELVGEIWDEHDEVVEDIVKVDIDKYRILCSMGVEEMFRYFDLEQPEDEESVTVSGWVMACLDKIPEEGDAFESDGLAVRVTKVELFRVLEIEVEVLSYRDTLDEDDEN